MFQDFEEKGSSAESAARLAQLRAILSQAGVDGFILPRSDEFQNEYIPDSAERLRWLTGFTGSAGFAVILPDRAVAFSDGRYAVQLPAQLDPKAFSAADSTKIGLPEFLSQNAKGLRIGFDPWMHTAEEVAALRKAAATDGFEMVALSRNPVDLVWQDRPAPPKGRVAIHPDAYAGQSAEEKRAQMDAALEKADADLCVLTDPCSLAWVLNIRGADVIHKPLPLAFTILRRGALPLIFLDPDKIDPSDRPELERRAELREPETFERLLRQASRDAKVMIDTKLAARRIVDIVEGAGGTVVEGRDPALLPRARKNAVEVEGARQAHLRDGAAMASFLAWMDAQEPGSLTEIDAARKLEALRIEFARANGMELKDISFDTISAAGPNAALPHYRVSTASNRTIRAGEVYLVDSGGQYLDGTTDITRTIAVGDVPEHVRRAFTLVLKGMIAVSTARFPKGTRGTELDPLARIALWRHGLDYAHGTGHGVGSYLGVHEGPQSISRRGTIVIEDGMILSNEPGCYREGEFGIRIENLILTLPAEPIEGGDLPMHGFETLTFAPIDRRMIVPALLEDLEADWLDAYHAQVRTKLTPLLDAEDGAWLARATAPLAR